MMDDLGEVKDVREDEEREGRSADGGLFIAVPLKVSASSDAETQVLPAQPQPTRKVPAA
jgi:hypothetical protein